MIVSVILGHPKKGSFNHAIAETAVEALQANGHIVRFHDLADERFNPLMPAEEFGKDPSEDPLVLAHCGEITEVDGIVIVHPNWWAMPPAIMKGWIDRVLRQGVAYRFGVNDKGEGVPIGLLKATTALVFNTSNTPQEREIAVFGDPLENLWKTCIFDFCGVKNVHRRQYNVIVTSTPEQRKAWLHDVHQSVERHFPES